MADADLTQYNRAAADAETANGQNALTSQLLLPTDGTDITADTNGAGDSPVNRGIKKLAEMIAGLRGAWFGNVGGVAKRTIYSLLIDGTGGSTHTETAGTLKLKTAATIWNVLGPGGMDLIDTAGSTCSLRNIYMLWTGTAAGSANPASTASLANKLTPLNIVKCHGHVTFTGGTATVADGAHITSAAPNGPNIKITFASSFDNDDYTVVRNGQDGGAVPVHVKVAVRNVAYVELLLIGVDAAVDDGEVDFAILGRQTT